MPPIGSVLHNNHGRPGGAGGLGGIVSGTPLLSRDFITDQTWHLMTSILGSTLWNFVAGADGGFGSAAGAGASFWYFPGGLPRQKQTWDFQYNTHAAGGAWGGLSRLNYHSSTDPSGGAITTIGYYFLRMRNNDSFRLSRVDNAGIADLATQAITALDALERYRQTLTILYNPALGTQSFSAQYLGRARTRNSPGAANYNLAAVADPCYLRVEVDGVDVDVEFASGDALVVANGGLGALTNAGVAAVINDQVASARAWVPTGATYVDISSLLYGSSGTIRCRVPGILDDANTVLAFPTPASAVAGEQFTLTASDNTFVNGFNGARGGYVANTACFLRSYTLEGL